MRWILLGLVLFLSACAPGIRPKEFPKPIAPEPIPPEVRLKPSEKPYVVRGERYEPLRNGKHLGFVQEGLASWYGKDFHGKSTSSGEAYDMYGRTAAHKTLPLGLMVKVTNLSNSKEVKCRINDRGPFIRGRIIDLSYALAKELGVVERGTAPVRVEALASAETTGQVVAKRQKSKPLGRSYAIQIAAFFSRDKADRLASELQSRHKDVRVEVDGVKNDALYHVRIGKYVSPGSAECARADLAKNGYSGGLVVVVD